MKMQCSWFDLYHPDFTGDFALAKGRERMQHELPEVTDSFILLNLNFFPADCHHSFGWVDYLLSPSCSGI
jgi:hypothetical protein